MNDIGIALIAHDGCERDMVDWARFNRDVLAAHRLRGVDVWQDAVTV